MSNTGGLISTSELTNSSPPVHTSGLLNKKRKSKKRGNTAKLINAHYLEMEYLLSRIENSTTHYQTLGVERTTTSEKVIDAYHQVIGVLHHPYYKVRAAVPDEVLERIDKAFLKASEAFSVLTHHSLRSEYDKSLQRKVCTPLPLEIPEPDEIKAPPIKCIHSAPVCEDADRKQTATADSEMAAVKIATALQPAYWKPADKSDSNRRRCERFKLIVPVLVAGYDPTGKWQEVTKTIDVSRMGVALRLKRRLQHGAVVHVTLPLPTKLRNHGFSEPGYNVYAIVRRVEPIKDGTRVVGLEFLGKNPPAGYLHKPWATFRTEKWKGADRRSEPRFDKTEQVVIEYLDKSLQTITREVTITENVSSSGARVLIKVAPAEFEMVRVINASRGFQSLALVRNQYVGRDSYERLCLQFTESKWPV